MPHPRNPFGLHTIDELFDIYEAADLTERPVGTLRRRIRQSGIQAVAWRGRRKLYRGADVWPLRRP